MSRNTSDPIRHYARRTTRRRAVALIFICTGAIATLQLAGTAQRGGFGGPMQQERKVVGTFDKNGDKRLDAAERKAAREWLATQPAGGFGGRGGFGRGGNVTPAEPGRRLAPGRGARRAR